MGELLAGDGQADGDARTDALRVASADAHTVHEVVQAVAQHHHPRDGGQPAAGRAVRVAVAVRFLPPSRKPFRCQGLASPTG